MQTNGNELVRLENISKTFPGARALRDVSLTLAAGEVHGLVGENGAGKSTLFNLITDLVGGIRVSVLEEEVVAREDRGLGWRRGGRSRPVVPEEKEPG